MTAIAITCLFSISAIVVSLRIRWFKRKLIANSLNGSNISIEALPTVSVCIPARNEAHALSVCLERILASDYPKLEIIVLDDESEDNTSILIKSFAHAGVRFIAGKKLPAGWLGKNHALDTLAREASGDYVLFCDVDTKLEISAIRNLMTIVAAKEKRMISIIPSRNDIGRQSAVFGHARYLWNILFDYPGAMSVAWCIDRNVLLSRYSGFNRVASDVQPERFFATAMKEQATIVSGNHMGFAYEKRWHSQVESSERLMSPMFRRAGVKGLITALWLIVWALSLPTLIVTAILKGDLLTITAFGVVLSLGTGLYGQYLSVVWRQVTVMGVIVWPWTALQELLLLILSVYRYGTHTTMWKGRAVSAQPVNDAYLSLSD